MTYRVTLLSAMFAALGAASCADEDGGTVVETIGAEGSSQCGNGNVEEDEECDDEDDDGCSAMCTFHVCGDGLLAPDEECDDANDDDDDTCTAKCELGPTAVVDLALGAGHTCALSRSGRVKCWGAGSSYGVLGQPGFDENIGDDEPPSDWDDVVVGADVVALSSGREHMCGRRASGAMFCWGDNGGRRLGYLHADAIGDDETPADAGDLALTGVDAIAAGESHTCALANGEVTCWGNNGSGQLGYGDTMNTTDGEEAGTRGAVALPGTVAEIAAGDSFTCARLESGSVHCWGRNAEGQLGTGAPQDVGDDETPDSVDAIELGGKAVDIDASGATVCAALEDGGVRCWGANNSRQLGNGDTKNVGDRKTPAQEGVVMFDGIAKSVEVGVRHACAVTDAAQVYCWGNTYLLGHENEDADPLPTAAVKLGAGLAALEIGREHSCAITTAARVRCWGNSAGGRLGIPGIGGGTLLDPSEHGDVDVF